MPNSLPPKRVVAGAPQSDLQRAALAGVERNGAVDTVLRAIGTGVIYAAIQGGAGGARVLHLHRDLGK